MPFVKLDCGMLYSTTWADKPARDVFLTALLLARPCTFDEPVPQIKTDSLEETGFMIPPGEYGFAAASGPGLIYQAKVTLGEGMEALARLGAPDPESRSQEFDGRRLARVAGGYVVLNFRRYRDKDYTAAERQRRFQERKRAGADNATNAPKRPLVTQAEDRGKRVEGRGSLPLGKENLERESRGSAEGGAPASPSPTLSEIASLWTAEGLRGDPEDFRLWNGAHGWPAGDWRDAARLWSRREKGEDPGPRPEPWGARRPPEADLAVGMRSEPEDETEPAPDGEPRESGEG